MYSSQRFSPTLGGLLNLDTISFVVQKLFNFGAVGMADEEEDPTFEEEIEEIGGGAEGGQGKRKILFF
jgi:hypothetical protein